MSCCEVEVEVTQTMSCRLFRNFGRIVVRGPSRVCTWLVPNLPSVYVPQTTRCVFLLDQDGVYNTGTDPASVAGNSKSNVATVTVVRSSKSNGTRNRLDKREIPRINIINVTFPSVSPRPLDATSSPPGGLCVSGFPGRVTRDDRGMAGSDTRRRWFIRVGGGGAGAVQGRQRDRAPGAGVVTPPGPRQLW